MGVAQTQLGGSKTSSNSGFFGNSAPTLTNLHCFGSPNPGESAMSNLRPPPADGNCFYILTEDCAYGNKYFQAGNLCFCSERSYLRNFSEDGPPACFLKVVMLDDSSTVTINLEILQPVRQEAAGFLLAIGSHSERLDLFLERLSLEGALRAVPGQNVVVEVEREFFPGVLRYIGSIYKPSLAVLTPVFFGVELQVRRGPPKQRIPHFSMEFLCVTSLPGLFSGRGGKQREKRRILPWHRVLQVQEELWDLPALQQNPVYSHVRQR